MGSILTAQPPAKSEKAQPRKWESQTRLRLMDGGMFNNLPSHILAHPGRGMDIIVAFDASSDIESRHTEQRLHHYAEDCHMSRLEDVTSRLYNATPKYDDMRTNQATDAAPTAAAAAAETEATYLHRYVKVFEGVRESSGKELDIVYCPLLPNGVNPGFDPSVSCFG
ncbi:acyl transferase/acyl hydrolase/lysophospholipase [Apiospora saccharicola]|uniref:Acyl transferase/acyl hydrolase/lysophospholipase n=1 Tax=Apiospora saccharicola TaxID=335842 RepID=A0ABR1UFA7_9PEZI